MGQRLDSYLRGARGRGREGREAAWLFCLFWLLFCFQNRQKTTSKGIYRNEERGFGHTLAIHMPYPCTSWLGSNQLCVGRWA